MRANPYGVVVRAGRVLTEFMYSAQLPLSLKERAKLVAAAYLKKGVSADRAISFSHGYQFNYYHFVAECLVRLFLMRDHIDRSLLIFPTDPQGFHREWFEFLGVADRVLYVAPNRIVRGEIISCPFPAKSGNQDEHVIRDFGDWLPESGDSPLGRKLLIGRAPGTRRQLTNLDAVKQALPDFEYTDLSGFTVPQQAAIFRNATDLVALHGAALTNLVFAKQGTRVVEFVNRELSVRFFENIARPLGHDYTRIDCDPVVSSGDSATQNHCDITADLRALLSWRRAIGG